MNGAARLTRETDQMFMFAIQPAVEPQGCDAVAVPGAPTIREATPRALHARLLENAALRRLRGMERKRAHREDDAGYWFNAAPAAVRKASELRLCTGGFSDLP